MTPEFRYDDCRIVSPSDPWPVVPRYPFSYVTLHHDLLTRYGLIVQNWENGRLQLERLNALAAAGYVRRVPGQTDYRLWDQARNASSRPHVFDHDRHFRHGDTSVILVHTYDPIDVVELVVPVVCARLCALWKCDITFRIDESLNVYFPGSGTGFEIRRPASARGPRRGDR